MVLLHVKRGDESLFLYDVLTSVGIDELSTAIANLHNTRLRIARLCMEVQQLAEHGLMKPPEMQGLTDEQIEELKLVDEFAKKCYPSGGVQPNPDPIGRRAGNAPTPQLAEVLMRTISEASKVVSKDQVAQGIPLTMAMLQEAIDKIKGAVMIVYPMGLPPHEEVHAILTDTEDLDGKQDAKLAVPPASAELWWAGKELQRHKKLCDFVGKNEKSKAIVKLQKKGAGAPAREPVVPEATQKLLMAHAYQKQQEMEKLAADDSDAHLSAPWADPSALKARLQGTSGLSWK